MSQPILPKLLGYTDGEWRDLSREDQIQHWQRFLAVTSRHTTPFELSYMILMNAVKENVDIDGLLATCSPTQLQNLIETVRTCPADDDNAGWSNCAFHIAAYYGPITKEEYLKIKQEEKEGFRSAVLRMRRHPGFLSKNTDSNPTAPPS